MQILGTYKFPNITDVTFTDPTIEITPIVNQVNPEAMTINVEVFIPMEGSASGKWYIDINPVPVINLDYNQGELAARILERIEDFKI